MAVSRADKITQQASQQVMFSDFTANFDVHPDTGDLFRLTNVNAIKASLKNLIYTNFYDRPFEPKIGCNIRAMLFENIAGDTLSLISEALSETIRKFEPRVNLININVSAPADSNQIVVNAVFSIINIPQTQTLNVVLNRVR